MSTHQTSIIRWEILLPGEHHILEVQEHPTKLFGFLLDEPYEGSATNESRTEHSIKHCMICRNPTVQSCSSADCRFCSPITKGHKKADFSFMKLLQGGIMT